MTTPTIVKTSPCVRWNRPPRELANRAPPISAVQVMWPNAEFWAVPPTGSDLVWFNTIYDVLLAIWSLIGATWVVLAWRRYSRRGATAIPKTVAGSR